MLIVCSNEDYLDTPWVKNEYSRFLSMTANGYKQPNSLTFVYSGKPIEKLPNGKKIQGIDRNAYGASGKIADFVRKFQPQNQRRTKFCAHCGNECRGSAKMCDECGSREFFDTHEDFAKAQAVAKARKEQQEREEQLKREQQEREEQLRKKLEEQQAEREKQLKKEQQASEEQWRRKLEEQQAKALAIAEQQRKQAKENQNTYKYCFKCGTQCKQTAKFCPDCGGTTFCVTKFCADCGTENSGANTTCTVCGSQKFVQRYSEYEKLVAARKASEQVESKVKHSTIDWDILKKILKIAIPIALVVIIVVSIIIGVSVSKANYRKTYSLDNIEISVTKKTDGTKESSYYNGLVLNLYFDISNNGSAKILQIDGEMAVYKGESNLLMTWDLTFKNLEISQGETENRGMICDASYSEEMEEFYQSSLDELMLSFQIDTVYFAKGDDSSEYEKITNSENVVKTIKPYDSQILETKYQNALSLLQQGKFDEAYQLFSELGTYRDASEKMTETLMEKEYRTALSLMQQGKYKDAYEMFSGIYDYKDSSDKITEVCSLQKAVAQKSADVGDYQTAESLMEAVGESVDAWRYAAMGNWKKAVESGLVNVVLPEGTTTIENSAFSGCDELKSVKLPFSLQIIEAEAFKDCYGLTSITIPQNVYSIGSSAFSGCYKLVEVYNLSAYLVIPKESSNFGMVAYYAIDVFTNVNQKSHIVVRQDKFVFYESDSETFLLDYIGSDADVNLPTIGKQYTIYPVAFYCNDVMRKVDIPDGITEIGEYAFYDCSNLSQVTVGNDVVSIGVGAFYYCSQLSSVTLGNKLQTIMEDAFSYCTSLQRITIPSSVTSIENSAFYYAGLVYAKFEVTEGWRTIYKAVDPQELADPANAASYLLSGSYSAMTRS